MGSHSVYKHNVCGIKATVNSLNAELNPICHSPALLGGATIVVVSRLRVKILYWWIKHIINFDSDRSIKVKTRTVIILSNSSAI